MLLPQLGPAARTERAIARRGESDRNNIAKNSPKKCIVSIVL